MGKFDNVFNQLTNQKDISGDFAEKPEIGDYEVTLTKYEPTTSKKDENETRIEIEFAMADRSIRGWVWYIGKGGWFGKYETERARKFVEVVAKSLGENKTIAAVGNDLCDGVYSGIKLKMSVKQKVDKGKPVTYESGEPILVATFYPIEGQTRQSLVDNLARLNGGAPAAETAAATTVTAPPATATGGLLGGLRKPQ